MICRCPRLFSLDERMASLYFTLRYRLSGPRRAAPAQLSCSRDYRCIENAWLRRIQVLSNR